MINCSSNYLQLDLPAGSYPDLADAEQGLTFVVDKLGVDIFDLAEEVDIEDFDRDYSFNYWF